MKEEQLHQHDKTSAYQKAGRSVAEEQFDSTRLRNDRDLRDHREAFIELGGKIAEHLKDKPAWTAESIEAFAPYIDLMLEQKELRIQQEELRLKSKVATHAWETITRHQPKVVSIAEAPMQTDGPTA